MSVQLTQLAADNFQRANVFPLASPWAIDANSDTGLQIESAVCIPRNSIGQSVQLYNYAGGTPNDQYASITLGPSWNTSNAAANFAIRLTDQGGFQFSNPCYYLDVSSGEWFLATNLGGMALAYGFLAPSPGDVITVAVVGTTLYVVYNGTQVAAVTDSTYSSGQTALSVVDHTNQANAPISNFAMGSAAAVGSISGNAGVPGATVSYSGAASGSVTADGSGNYTIPDLADGSYTVTPSSGSDAFTPSNQNETISGHNDITGVNFAQVVCNTPSISPAAGSSYSFPLEVTITDALGGATITYTTDGSDPVPGVHGTQLGSLDSFFLSGPATVKAIASNTGYDNSAIATAVYTVPFSSDIFLGSVVEDDSASDTILFLGSVTVVAEAPGGVPNPYLGKIKSGSPAAGQANPLLGQIVIIDSSPGGLPDPLLGKVQKG